MEPFAIVFIILFIFFYLALLALAVVSYVLGSKGIYAIAARRGIRNPWMAWIPVANSWILGSISDQYQQRKYGEDPKLRKKLLIFSIITQSGATITPAVGSFHLNLNLGNDSVTMVQNDEVLRTVGIVLAVILVPILLAMLVLTIIQTVYQYKAYYSLYASCKPQMAIAFLILSIVTPAGPFLTYACRNSDDGLPPEQSE